MENLNGFSAILAVLLIAVNSQELVKGKSNNVFSSQEKRFILLGSSTQKKFSRGTFEKRNCQCRMMREQKLIALRSHATSENFVVRYLSLDEFLYSHYLIV